MSADLPDQYFRSIVNAAGIGVIATDEQRVVRFCNDSAAEMIGRSAAELLTQPVISIVPPDRVELAQRLLDRIAVSGNPSDFDISHVRPDGTAAHLAITISPIRQDDRICGLAVFIRDVTRQMNLLRHMAQAQKMASLESMAGAVAHHFNNILGGAVTTADFALTSDDPDLHKRTLGITVTALSRANELTRGLLSFAEGEHTDTITVDVRQTIERYIVALTPTLQASNIRLDAHIETVPVSAPAKGLTTVLDRLIANAVEAMPTGGILYIALHQESDNHALLEISDTGSGISEQNRQRIFEPFFTTKQPNRYRPSNHPGLGLAVVHGIVKDLRATISVSQVTRPGTGTVFTIRLPCHPVK